jgi:hypothetical protein
VGLVLVLFFVVPGGCARVHPPDVGPEPVGELKTHSRAFICDCNRCKRGYFDGVVVVVVVVTVVVGVMDDVTNADEVVDVGISADVTEVTARNDCAWALQVPVNCRDRGVARVGSCLAGGTRVGACFTDTAGPALKASGRTQPFKTTHRARVRDFASHCLPPLHSHLAPRALPH